MKQTNSGITLLLIDSFRTLGRDWRAGELQLLLAAVVLAVGALSSVGFFAERMRLGLNYQALQLLGGDLVVSADNPIPDSTISLAQKLGLKSVLIHSFPSMVQASQTNAIPQLASVKSVQAGYPLRGSLQLQASEGGAVAPATGIPRTGTVWVDLALAQALGLKIGSALQLGESSFTIAGYIVVEPDRGTNFMNLAPRILINEADLPGTQLIQPGSRVSYRLQLAGSAAAVALFQRDAVLARGQRFESLEAGRPELRTTLDRAQKFLSLVSLITGLIAACALAMGAQRFAARHMDGFAIQRALGATHRTLVVRALLELLWIGLIGAVLGAAVGYLAHEVLVKLAAGLLRLELPDATWLPAIQAGLAGLLLLIGFAALPIVRVAGVSPLRVLRRDLGSPPFSVLVTVGLAVASFGLLMFWIAGDMRLALLMLGGIIACVIVFSLASWGLMRVVLHFSGGIGSRLLGNTRFGLASIAVAGWRRRQASTVAQTTALALAMLALVLLTVTRNDLLDSWRASTPVDAPNRFMLNIQPDQRARVEALLSPHVTGATVLYPMVRGRLIAINGVAVSPEKPPGGIANDRAARLLDRELNLSYMKSEPMHNQTVAGRWILPDSNEVSVEQGIAQSLGLKLGDRIKFDVAGEFFEVNVVGMRKLAWDSLKINFFMIVSPAALKDRPQTLVTSVHLPDGKESVTAELLKEVPNLTIFDAGQIARQVRQVIDQVSSAVQFLFLFTLLAGIMVLYASQLASRDDRMQQAGLLRALGASRQQLARAQWWELSFLGALAGALAGVGALAIGAVLARQVFEFNLSPNWWAIPVAMLVAALCSLSAGWLGLRGVLNSPPLQTLRNH